MGLFSSKSSPAETVVKHGDIIIGQVEDVRENIQGFIQREKNAPEQGVKRDVAIEVEEIEEALAEIGTEAEEVETELHEIPQEELKQELMKKGLEEKEFEAFIRDIKEMEGSLEEFEQRLQDGQLDNPLKRFSKLAKDILNTLNKDKKRLKREPTA